MAAKKSRSSKRKGLDPKKDFEEPVRRARQTRLPGMEDSPIKDLEEAAIEHSDTLGEIREKRAAMKTIDARIATLMKREGKKTYNHAGITLKLRKGEESVSVKVKRHEREGQTAESEE